MDQANDLKGYSTFRKEGKRAKGQWTWLLFEDGFVIIGTFSLEGGLKIELECPCFSYCPGEQRQLETKSRDF